MNTKNFTIRLEKTEDHREVENLVRESFWNVYRPGCSEHYVIHVLRDDPAFIKELDLVMEQDGRLIGQNMFMKTIIEADDGRVIPVLTMGPIGIIPELKRKGYGKALLDYSLEKAEELGYGAVLFEGNIGRKQRNLATALSCSRATSASMVIAASHMPASLASVTMTCRKARMTLSFSAGN